MIRTDLFGIQNHEDFSREQGMSSNTCRPGDQVSIVPTLGFDNLLSIAKGAGSTAT